MTFYQTTFCIKNDIRTLLPHPFVMNGFTFTLSVAALRKKAENHCFHKRREISHRHGNTYKTEEKWLSVHLFLLQSLEPYSFSSHSPLCFQLCKICIKKAWLDLRECLRYKSNTPLNTVFEKIPLISRTKSQIMHTYAIHGDKMCLLFSSLNVFSFSIKIL